MDTVKLNDGNSIPALGFGVFMLENDGTTKRTVLEALDAGYRSIDTAAAYFNEAEVGEAVRESGIAREEIFVTSKLWHQDYGYEAAKKGIETSLRKLGLDYIDLYLLHHPYGDAKGAWKALEEAVDEGKIKSIGVSNHTVKYLKELLPSVRIMPAVNQMECNPFFQQKELRAFMEGYGIRLEAWYPLGHGNSKLLQSPEILKIAEKYGKNAGQVILRWHVQEGIIAVPKASSPEHIKGNLDIFDFELSREEMLEIRKMDTGKGSHDPERRGVSEMLLWAFDVHKDD